MSLEQRVARLERALLTLAAGYIHAEGDGTFTVGDPSMSAADILAALVTVDGAGSGLDADLLDGQSSAAFEAAGTASTLVGAHEADTTSVHGIADTSLLLDTADLGVTVQGYDGDLAAIAGLTPTNDDIIQRKAGAWTNRTLTQLLADLLPAFGSYTPSWTGVTVNNGTVTARYLKFGSLVFFRVHYVRGSSDSLSGAVTVSLPVTAATFAARQEIVGTCRVFFLDANVSSSNFWDGTGKFGTTTLELVELSNNASGNDDTNALSSTAPFTWATNDEMMIVGWYEAA